MDGSRRVTIVGGGLGGSLLACYLGRSGHEVDVYELRDDMCVAGYVGGRSINLAISHRGLAALERIGLKEEILAQSVAMRGRMIHSPTGELTFQRYGKDDTQCIHSVSRGALNIALLKAAARHPTVRLHFNQKCTAVDTATGAATFVHTLTNQNTTLGPGVVLSADGAFSAVRRSMQKMDRFNYRQDFLEHGYKELHIPATPDGGFRLEPNVLHIWPRRSYMMIALPNIDGSYTCTCFWPLEGPISFDALKTANDVEQFFRTHFPDAVPHMPTLTHDYLANPTGTLVTIRCWPWQVANRILLLGDAAHAIVPFYGQGANAAFEDVLVLDECLRDHGSDWGRAFTRFAKLRKRNTDVLADLAIGNFIEMRDHTGSRAFLYKKKAEKLLSKLLPWWYVPLYTMVSFTRTPYADAVEKARRQNCIVIGVAGALLILAAAILLTCLA